MTQKDIDIMAVQAAKQDAERVYKLLEFVQDWPRENAAAALDQASQQMALLAMMPETSVARLIERLRQVEKEVIEHAEAASGIRPS